MSSPTAAELLGRRCIIVADEDPKIVAFIIQTLRQDGYSVFHAYDGLAATELTFALGKVHLVITKTMVNGLPGIKLIGVVRHRFPELPMLYIANIDRSTPAIEAQLPGDVPILREPFTADHLRAVVGALLSGERQPIQRTGLA